MALEPLAREPNRLSENRLAPQRSYLAAWAGLDCGRRLTLSQAGRTCPPTLRQATRLLDVRYWGPDE